MNKTELTKAMQNHTGSSFITRLELMKFMGYKNPSSVDRYLHSLERVDKRYFIPDVAGKLIEAAAFR